MEKTLETTVGHSAEIIRSMKSPAQQRSIQKSANRYVIFPNPDA